ncbi:Thiol-specific monooxygenase [Geodia barretti]|uniref:Flavin-containing monooxygenase n=1 Tax=Geodia barretti TaxID=519541 RepID=A0AA35WJ64_GEOBA|nr:Thiol-specific monooxygenase [Geodia barretti]
MMYRAGHYSKPYIPAEIPDLDNFPGTVVHSHVFRRPDRYAGKRVLIVGPRASSSDILLHVAPLAHSAGKCVNHVYKHTFNIQHPSMVFVGLNYPVVPFSFLRVQVRFVLSVLTGHMQLLSQEDMLADCRADELE